LVSKLALAETWNPWRADRDDEGPYEDPEPTQIQICPWFLAWLKDRKFKLLKDAMATTIGKTVLQISEKTPFAFAQIGV
jgi:hypothetical protein